MDDIAISPTLSIPAQELEFRFSRASGPGGQHVNTSSTKVELRFDVERSAALSDAQRARIRRALGTRMTSDGVLVLQSAEHRSQVRNREAVMARFAALLEDALRPPKRRRPTAPSQAARERRLAQKRQRAERKALRRPPDAGA